jgi:signal transduction histidine kinase
MRADAGRLLLEVQDNGKGITETELSGSKSLGLLGMRERAMAFGGSVEFAGAGGKGTRVTVVLPLDGK